MKSIWVQRLILGCTVACLLGGTPSLCLAWQPAAEQQPEAGKTAAVAEEFQFDRQRNVIYAEPAGEKLMADILQPRGEGPFPAVLMVHGGAWRMGSKQITMSRAVQLARRGYCVMTINYRLAPKYKFPAQWDDCVAALAYMQTNAKAMNIDTNRVAGFGYSAGAHLVTLLGTTDKLDLGEGVEAAENPAIRLKAVVAGGTPTEFRVLPLDNDFLSYWLGGTRREKPKFYAGASPRFYVSRDDVPIFLFHGTKDTLVPLLAATTLAKDLQNVNVPVEFFTVKQAGHLMAYVDAAAFEAAVKFLDTRLKP